MKNPCHILLVEDDQDDVDLLKDAFGDTNSVSIDVLMHGDLVVPWLLKCKNLPNIIVMDLNLPKKHGREVLLLLKSTNVLKNIPIIILTTSSSKFDVEYCMKNGAAKFITKPNTHEGFQNVVNVILNLARRTS